MIIITGLLTVFSILRTPSFQVLGGRLVAGFLSDKLHYNVYIDNLKISDLLFLEMKGLRINDYKNQEMLHVNEFRIKLKKFSIKKHVIDIDRVSLQTGGFYLRRYPEDSLLNLAYLARSFSSDTAVTTGTAPVWNIFCKDIVISDFNFGLLNGVPDSITGINFDDLYFTDIFIDINNVSVLGDSIAAFINHIGGKEKSGIELFNFSGDAKISSTGIRVKDIHISTIHSSLDLDLDFLYKDYDKLSSFLDSVYINSVLRSSLVTISDIGYFAPDLLVMDDPVMISGLVEGPVSDFSVRNLILSFGEFTEFKGSVSMRGLPDFMSSYFYLDIERMITTPEDLKNFSLPVADQQKMIPPELEKMGFTSIKGFFDGHLNNFRTELDVNSDAGVLHVLGKLTNSGRGEMLTFGGKIDGYNIQMGSIFENEDLGNTTIEMEFEGHGSNLDNLGLSLNGFVQDFEYKKHRYGKIIMGGTTLGRSFSGRVMVLDSLLSVDFNGLVDFNGEYPLFDFTLDLEKAFLHQLNLIQRSEDVNLTGHIVGKFKGMDTETFYGKIIIDSLYYLENTELYHLDHFELSRFVNPRQRPDSIIIRSDFIDGDLEANMVLKKLVEQLRGIALGKMPDDETRLDIEQNPQYVAFKFKLKDVEPVTALFLPFLELSPGAEISGLYNSGDQIFKINGSADTVIVSGIEFNGLSFVGSTTYNDFKFDVDVRQLVLQEDDEGNWLGLSNLNAGFVAGDDSINYLLKWDNYDMENPNSGMIDGFARVSSMTNMKAGIFSAEANFGRIRWIIEDENLFTMDSSSIGLHNFRVHRDEQSLFVDGVLSQSMDDTLSVYFEKWSLANFNPLLERVKMNVKGIINGRLGIIRNQGNINFFSKINVSDFQLNNVFFGDAEFRTRWKENEQALATDLNIFSKGSLDKPYKILGVNGNYYPFDDTRNFDFDIAAQNLNISVLGPLLSSFSSHIEGFATGKLTLEGTTEKPLLLGRLKLQRTELLIDYLNIMYSFSNEVVFSKDILRFNDLTVYDPNSNQAVLSGGIRHNYFQDMSLDLTINPVNFMSIDLNRYQNEIFYGKAFTTGTVSLTGPFNNISIKVDAKTERDTRISIPINYSVDVSQTDFIVFTGGTDTAKINAERELKVFGLSLDIGMNITRDAEIEIYLPGSIGNIRARGDGKLRLGVDPNGYFTLKGSYIIQTGQFVFSLEQLVSRRFEILEGSKISWNGDIYDAEVGIVARYRLRTSLDGLGISMIDPDAASQKVIVNTDIRMSGSLFNPDLTFGITFPNLQEQTRQAVYAVLDTNDKGLMNQQAISLLVLGSFSNTGTEGTNPVNPAAIVSSTLSNMLSQISNDFNIGINYVPGDQVSTEQLEVALSTQLLDNRLIIDGNIDVSSNDNSQKTSSIVGDINIEYKLTPDGRFRVKAFNRSNDLSLFNDYAPYTQGVGIFYRKDFNNLRELFEKSQTNKKQKRDK